MSRRRLTVRDVVTLSAEVVDVRLSWTALRRSLLPVQGARDNALEALLAERVRAAQRREAVLALHPDRAERPLPERDRRRA